MRLLRARASRKLQRNSGLCAKTYSAFNLLESWIVAKAVELWAGLQKYQHALAQRHAFLIGLNRRGILSLLFVSVAESEVTKNHAGVHVDCGQGLVDTAVVVVCKQKHERQSRIQQR